MGSDYDLSVKAHGHTCHRSCDIMELTQLEKTTKPLPISSLPSHGDLRIDGHASTLEEWIKRCGVSERERHEGADSDVKATFIDDHGVLRYAEDWQSVENVIRNNMKEDLNNTGCMNIPVAANATSRGKSPGNLESAAVGKAYTVSFLMDFRVLWNHFELDGNDEVAEYSPMFRIYIETFFHRRTIQLMITLTAYYIVVLVVVNQVYPIFSPFEQFVSYFYVLSQAIVYLALVRLFKGSIFGDITSTITNESTEQKDVNMKSNHVKRGIKRNQPSTWRYFMWEAIQTTTIELQRFWSHHPEPASNVSFSNKEKAIPFYVVLGIALKFLTKHSREGGAPVRLNRRLHNAKLLFIFIIVPLYSLAAICASPIGPVSQFITACRVNGQQSDICQNYYWVCSLSLGYTVAIVQKIIFLSAVLLSLVGLSFGAEIGRGLVDSWIHRFGMLRRLSSEASEARPISTPEDPDTVINALHQRVADKLRAPVTLSMPIADVLPYLQRDAFEHYLFIKEYMSIASAAWSPTIVALTFLDAFFVLLFLYGAFTVGTVLSTIVWIYCSCWIFIRVSALSIYPIMALAHANAYVYALQEQFLVAAPEDFAVIGGRDSWLEYLDKVPAIWTIYGVWVTWDRLTGLLWTAVAGLGAVAVTYVSSN